MPSIKEIFLLLCHPLQQRLQHILALLYHLDLLKICRKQTSTTTMINILLLVFRARARFRADPEKKKSSFPFVVPGK